MAFRRSVMMMHDAIGMNMRNGRRFGLMDMRGGVIVGQAWRCTRASHGHRRVRREDAKGIERRDSDRSPYANSSGQSRQHRFHARRNVQPANTPAKYRIDAALQESPATPPASENMWQKCRFLALSEPDGGNATNQGLGPQAPRVSDHG